MAIADPVNQLTGTPMGPLSGIAAPNPLVAGAMNAPAVPAVPSVAGQAPELPTRENLTRAFDANTGMSKLLAGLLATPKLSTKNVVDAMASAVGSGHMTAHQAAAELAKMPAEDQGLRAWVQGHFIRNMEMGRRLTQIGQQVPAPVKVG